jgi:hypothetical protein
MLQVRRVVCKGVYNHCYNLVLHLRPYRDEPSASRPIRADKHRRGQRVLTWVTSREHCAAAGFFLDFFSFIFYSRFFLSFFLDQTVHRFLLSLVYTSRLHHAELWRHVGGLFHFPAKLCGVNRISGVFNFNKYIQARAVDISGDPESASCGDPRKLATRQVPQSKLNILHCTRYDARYAIRIRKPRRTYLE